MTRGFTSVILLFLCCYSYAQEPLRRNFWLNESNTDVNVSTILQDTAGYLWVGADDGLYRFNGRSFTKLYDTLTSAVTALTKCNGNIYAGYANGCIGIVNHDSVAIIAIGHDAPRSQVRDMYAGIAGLLWVCTEEGIFAILNNFGVVINTANGLSDNFTYSLIATGHRILAGTDQGINIMGLENDKARIWTHTSAQGLPDNIIKVIRAGADHKSYWIGTQDGGVALWSKSRVQPYKGSWKWGEINDIIALPGNRAWVATETGYLLEVRADSDLHVIPYLLSDCKLNKIQLTRTGNIWCATNKGLSVITADYISAVKVEAPYLMDSLGAIAADGSGNLWFTKNADLFRISLHDSLHRPQHILKAAERITCLYADSRNILWIGTLGKGVWYIKPGDRAAAVKGIDVLNNGSILSITGSGDNIWIAGLNGVEEIAYNNGSISALHHYTKLSGIGSDYVYQLFKDRSGNIWMATDGAGISMFDGKRFHNWDSTAGFRSKVVYSVTQDASGYIWAATLDSGLYRYDGSSWQQFSKNSGLRDLNISSVTANAAGQVVIVHRKGIDEWYTRAGDFRHFNSRTGLGIDSITNVLNCTAVDREGNIYLPYDKGFLVFKNSYSPVDFTPKVKITDVRVLLKSVISGDNKFSYNAHDVTISFDGISFTYVEQMNYRYMLEGYKNTWITTHDNEATFLELPAGEYRFRVQAALKSSFDKYNEADYYFTVAAPFWKKPWFIALCLLTILALGYLYINMRERNLRKIAQLHEERMMFEYEHLKSQVNPHFLFNSLNTLASLIEEDPGTAVDYTVHLSDLYRKVLTLRNKDLVPLGEEIEILRAFVYIQKSRFGDALDVNINIPEGLLTTKQIVPLSLQLLVENAIKHNVVSKDNPLSINITANDEEIRVANTLMPKYSKEKGSGLGLINIYKRYRLLTKRNMVYGPDNNEYVVKLPLL
ncbi:MAG: histidine kinase [Bacteroidetes bacterium]|nr:histidine kinase [Bacteroidota bacterium]